MSDFCRTKSSVSIGSTCCDAWAARRFVPRGLLASLQNPRHLKAARENGSFLCATPLEPGCCSAGLFTLPMRRLDKDMLRMIDIASREQQRRGRLQQQQQTLAALLRSRESRRFRFANISSVAPTRCAGSTLHISSSVRLTALTMMMCAG